MEVWMLFSQTPYVSLPEVMLVFAMLYAPRVQLRGSNDAIERDWEL